MGVISNSADETDRQSDKHTNILTTRLNRPQAQFSENKEEGKDKNEKLNKELLYIFFLFKRARGWVGCHKWIKK